MRLCLERILPRERAVEFALPPIKSAADIGEVRERSPRRSPAGSSRRGEAQAIARVFTTFVRTIETRHFDQRLQTLEGRQAQDRSSRAWPYSNSST